MMGARLANQFQKDRVVKVIVFNVKVFAYRPYTPQAFIFYPGVARARGTGSFFGGDAVQG